MKLSILVAALSMTASLAFADSHLGSADGDIF